MSLRLSESIVQHVAERLHVRLLLEVCPTAARQNEHKGPGVAAACQCVPFEIDWPLGLLGGVVNPGNGAAKIRPFAVAHMKGDDFVELGSHRGTRGITD